MPRTRHRRLSGKLSELLVYLPFHQEATGHVAQEEIFLEDVPFTGLESRTPATRDDPPDVDVCLSLDWTDEQLAKCINAAAKEQLPRLHTLVGSPAALRGWVEGRLEWVVCEDEVSKYYADE